MKKSGLVETSKSKIIPNVDYQWKPSQIQTLQGI